MLKCYSAVFTVINNADSGTGTFREALTMAAANGSADHDIIYFNLPNLSEAGRTITLISRLPNVSSNLTIDASTQPGAVFGISTARVQLLTAFPSPDDQIGLTLVNVNDVNLYSLYIRNLTHHNYSYKNEYWQGICIKDSRNIRIGAAGKGNVISGFFFDIGFNEQEEGGQSRHYCVNMIIQSNFVSIEPDGFSVSPIPSAVLGLAQVYGQVEIGGSAEEGNLFAKGLGFGQLNVYDSTDPGDEISSLPATIRISNNKVGVNYSGTSGIQGSKGIRMVTTNPGGKNKVTIEDNVVSSDVNGIEIFNNGWPVIIRRNFVGVDRSKTIRLPILLAGIFVAGSESVTVGGDDPADANFIAYCKPVDVSQHSTVAVKKNSFFCTVNAYPMLYHEFIGGSDITEVSILNITTSSVSGTATPNSIIELFYSDQCGTCSPETYFASTTTDAAGNWRYSGPVNGAVIASATHNKSTSEFTRTWIDDSNVTIVPACSNSGSGSIRGAVPFSGAVVKWIDEFGNVVGTGADLLDVPPGEYTLQVINGDCIAEATYKVPRALILNIANQSISNPSCSGANGSVTGLVATNNTMAGIIYSWKNAAGAEVANTADLKNMKAGSYMLTISTADNSCSQIHGPFVLRNSTGANIIESRTIVTPSTCGGSTGEITGMGATGTGNLSYRWKNQSGQEVSATRDLLNQPAGTYFLEVHDESGCGPVSSSAFAIPEINGIIIADAATVNPSVCGGVNGSITGISVTGATKYEWFNGLDMLVSTTGPSLSNAVPGDYYMVASNGDCLKKTSMYTIGILVNTTNYGQPEQILKNASCGMNNGSIELIFNGTLPASYRWVDSRTGNTVGGNSSLLQKIDAGSYQLYVADQSGCEVLLNEYLIRREPELRIDDSNVVINEDKCGLRKGGISGIKVTGTEPLSFSWKDASGNLLGANLDIEDLKAGVYLLNVSDAVGCEKLISYTIINSQTVISPPEVSDLVVCTAGTALLWVKNISAQYGYRLYRDGSSLIPLDDQPSGQFSIEVKDESSLYISSYYGNCESIRKEVRVTVGSSSIQLPNTFTPNGDGINDKWVIGGIENYPAATVQLFNRYGSKVYESQKYPTPFDGTMNGYPLPVGTYYYIIQMTKDCKPVSGSLNILR